MLVVGDALVMIALGSTTVLLKHSCLRSGGKDVWKGEKSPRTKKRQGLQCSILQHLLVCVGLQSMFRVLLL
jgi:hypothetical protein